jgi:hypothetical protein
MEPEIDEDALLVAAVEDPEAFAQFYRRHVRGVLAYFRRRTPDAETAAERVSQPTARQRVSRGLAALRAHLRSQEP